MASNSKLLVRIPAFSKIVRNACIFNICLVSATNLDVHIKRVKILVGYLVDVDWVDPQFRDKMITQFSLFLESNRTNFATFKLKIK